MPAYVQLNPYMLAQRYVGIRELGARDHPLIQWWLSLCGYSTDTPDEVPWCSAFLNGIAWELRAERSRSAAARSWLNVGVPLKAAELVAGWDVVVLKRGGANQPGPEVQQAPGHVGLYAGMEGGRVLVLAGNQGNAVSIAPLAVQQVLGYRRIKAA